MPWAPFGFVIVIVIDEASLDNVTTGGKVAREVSALATTGRVNGAASNATPTSTARLMHGLYHNTPTELRTPG